MSESIVGLIHLAIYLFFLFGLPLLGLVVGSILERRHFASIHEREQRFLSKAVTTTREVDDGQRVADARLALGSCVISVDYYKRLFASLRNLFGGEIRGYAPLLDRARREAILRMKEQYPDADAYVNLRLFTTPTSEGQRQNALGAVEVLAMATAVRYRRDDPSM